MGLRYFINFVVICIVVVSCNTYDLPAGTPDCIEDLVADYEQRNDKEECFQVERYVFEGENYYKFVDDCWTDAGYNWYNSGCGLVCNTNNGWGTTTSIECSIDPSSMVFKEIIWPR